MRALSTAATGMAAQQLNVEVISNNIANMNTVGFKKQRAEFEDLLYQSIERPGVQSSAGGTIVPTGVQVGAGVKITIGFAIGRKARSRRLALRIGGEAAVAGRGVFVAMDAISVIPRRGRGYAGCENNR